MAYIGNNLTVQQYSPTIAYFNGDASTTAFTLPYAVVTASQIIVSVNNVVQNPSSAYTVSGTTLTFTSAPPSGTNNIWVEYTSLQTNVTTLPQNASIIGPLNVGINNSTPLGGATNPIVTMSGAANNYVQSYVYNTTNGANSSADFTAYPSNGADSAGWVDVGITGPTFSQAAYSITGANESYLFGSAPSGSGATGNLVIATDSTGTANAIQFYTGGFSQAKSAARMTIDGSGNVGIGVSSPTAKLQIANNTATPIGWALTTTQNSGSIAPPNSVGLSIGWNFSNGGGENNIVYGTTAGSTPGLVFSRYNGSTTAESMRIDSSGQLLVATSSPADNGKVYSKNLANSWCYIGEAGSQGGTYYFASWRLTGGGQIGSISSTNGTSTNYNTSSDYRLKENIAPMQNALGIVAKLKPVTYKWKADGSDGQGFIAHELQEVVPDCVTGAKDAVDAEGKPVYQGIDTSFLVATLTAALQEQQAIISDLKARIETLEAK